MKTFGDIFEAFGGTSGIASVLGVSVNHARTMRLRGSIPVEYWDKLVIAAADKGVGLSLGHLQAMRKARRHHAERAA